MADRTANDLLRMDANEAFRLGISYGMYKGFQITGYLEEYKRINAREIEERRIREEYRKKIRAKRLNELINQEVKKKKTSNTYLFGGGVSNDQYRKGIH